MFTTEEKVICVRRSTTRRICIFFLPANRTFFKWKIIGEKEKAGGLPAAKMIIESK